MLEKAEDTLQINANASGKAGRANESSSSKYGREKEKYDIAVAASGCRDLADFHDARRKLISNRYRPIARGNTRRKDDGGAERGSMAEKEKEREMNREENR